MPRRLLALLGLCLPLLLTGCIVRHPGPPPPRRHHIEVRPGHRHHRHHRRRHCRQVCQRWGHERHCERRCRMYSNGGCFRWEQHCSDRRVCRRYVDRCD
jgi:hypothetical protein